MKKLFFYTIIIIALYSCNQQKNKNQIKNVMQEDVCNCSGIDSLNKAIPEYAPMFEYLDSLGVLKGNLLCIKDTLSIGGLMCFTKEGFPVMVSDCYSVMNDDVENLLLTNRKPSKAKNLLKEYLLSHNFEYANGEKLTFENLPKCKYIFVIDFFIGLYETIPVKQYIKPLSEKIQKSEKSILIFVHPKVITKK